jgi:DNA transformation protein and related proteins
MKKLTDLPNIGEIMEKRLAAVDVLDAETLLAIGSKEAYIRLFQHEGDTCFSALCGLEGAVQGIRWHHLEKETKEDLRKFFESFK